MNTKEYRQKELKKVKIDGYKLAGNEVDYYKVGIKLYATNGDSTNQLTITNKEFDKIKKVLTKINY